MTVSVLYRDGRNNDVFTNVWEIQDNGCDEYVLKFHDHKCERISIPDVYGLEVDPDGNNQLYL